MMSGNAKILLGFILGVVFSTAVFKSPALDYGSDLVSGLLPSKTWNWCPKEVTKILVSRTTHEITDPNKIKSLCNASYKKTLPLSTTGKFQAILRAQNITAQVSFLEYDSSQKLFRTDSIVFQSEKFESEVFQVINIPH